MDTRLRRRVPRDRIAARRAEAPPPTRGRIAGLSEASCGRALESLRNGPRWATFATLTFPFPVMDGKEVKRLLDRLLLRLVRRGVSAFWTLEFQASGRPHLHLLLTQEVSCHNLRTMWASVLGHEGHVHVNAGAVRDRMRAIYYAAKRAGHPCRNVPDGFTDPGRFWGLRGPDARKVVLARVVAPREVVAKIWRPLRNLHASYARRFGRRRRRDNGVAGGLLWGVGGESVTRDLLRLVERIVGDGAWNCFHLGNLLVIAPGGPQGV